MVTLHCPIHSRYATVQYCTCVRFEYGKKINCAGSKHLVKGLLRTENTPDLVSDAVSTYTNREGNKLLGHLFSNSRTSEVARETRGERAID